VRHFALTVVLCALAAPLFAQTATVKGTAVEPLIPAGVAVPAGPLALFDLKKDLNPIILRRMAGTRARNRARVDVASKIEQAVEGWNQWMITAVRGDAPDTIGDPAKVEIEAELAKIEPLKTNPNIADHDRKLDDLIRRRAESLAVVAKVVGPRKVGLMCGLSSTDSLTGVPEAIVKLFETELKNAGFTVKVYPVAAGKKEEAASAAALADGMDFVLRIEFAEKRTGSEGFYKCQGGAALLARNKIGVLVKNDDALGTLVGHTAPGASKEDAAARFLTLAARHLCADGRLLQVFSRAALDELRNKP